MKLKFRIAELNIQIETDFDILNSGFSRAFVSDFEKSDINIFVRLGEINRTGELLYSSERCDVISSNGKHTVVIKDRQFKCDFFSVEQTENEYNCIISNEADENARDVFYIWNNVGLSHIMLENSRIIFHGSCVIYEDKAVIFSGKSGIGKSTQADLWAKHENAEIINGDKIILMQKEDKLFAGSLPIAGTSGICQNKIAQVKAIIFLEQSTENQICELSPAQKAGMLTSNCSYDLWQKNDIIKALDLSTAFFDKTEIYSYKCRADKSAVDYLKAVIK